MMQMETFASKAQTFLHDEVHGEIRFLYSVGLDAPKSESIESLLVSRSKEIGNKNLLYIKQSGPKFICQWSSDQKFTQKDMSNFLFVKDAQKFGFTTAIFENTLVTAVFFADPDGSSAQYIMAIQAPLDVVLNSIALKDPYEMSLINREGLVLASTAQNLVQKQFPNKTLFVLDNQKFYAFREKVEDSKLTLVISAPQAVLFKQVTWNFLLRTGLFLLVIVLVGGGIALFLTRKMSQPLLKLSQAMDQVEAGNLEVRYQPTTYGFEINYLGGKFNEMLDNLLENIQKAQKEKEHRLVVQQELHVARQIQDTLFPEKLDNLPFKLTSKFIPAKEVGGDFYDIYPITQKRFLITIADSAGKGVFASLFSHSLRSLLRAFAHEKNLETILEKVAPLYNEDSTKMSMFTTAFVAIYDADSKNLSYASLGHLPMYVSKNGKVEPLFNKNPAFGISEIENPQISQIQLEKNDRIFLYSDGLNEQINSQGSDFGTERITTVLENTSISLEEVVSTILDEYSEFRDEQPQADDLTIVAIEVT